MSNLINEELSKIDSLPKRESRKEYLTRRFGNLYDVLPEQPGWYNTPEYIKAKAIVKNSIGKNINQIRNKLVGLIPDSIGGVDEFLGWNYEFLTKDGFIRNSKGRLDVPVVFTWRRGKLLVRLDGYIVRSPYYRSGYKPTPLTKQTYEKEATKRKAERQLKKDIEFIEKYQISILNDPEKMYQFSIKGNIYDVRSYGGYRNNSVNEKLVSIVKQMILNGEI